jgi:uncharacterized protein YndB with AHSA1/START domain
MNWREPDELDTVGNAPAKYKLTLAAPSAREIVMTRAFDAPREAVFDAWTKPAHLARWFGPHGWTLAVCEVDLRPGGAWRFVPRGPEGTEMGMRGVYREIKAPERLVYTESFDDYPGETLNTITFSEENGTTTTTCRVLYATGAARDAVLKTRMKEGVSESFDRLAEYLDTMV